MITFTITDNTGTKKQVSAPHSWSELTLQQVLDIENDFKQPEGLIKLFSIITGLNVVDISQSKDRSLYKKIRDICEFVVDPPEWKTIACPKHLEIGDKIYKVPQNVNTIMHGQIESLAAIENPFESAARVVAIIMAPEVYKEDNYGRYRLDPKGKFYDRDQVEELIPVIQNSRGTDCIGITSFHVLVNCIPPISILHFFRITQQLLLHIVRIHHERLILRTAILHSHYFDTSKEGVPL